MFTNNLNQDDSKKTRRWGFIINGYLDNYPSELEKLESAFPLSAYEFELRPNIFSQSITATDLDSFQRACSTFMKELNQLIDKKNSFNLDLIQKFIALRIVLRLKNVLIGMQKGKNIWDVCKPYTIYEGSKKYQYPELFIEKEKEFQQEFISSVIEIFGKNILPFKRSNKAKKFVNGYEAGVFFKKELEPLSFVFNLDPKPEQIEDFLEKLIKKDSCNSFDKNFFDINSFDKIKVLLEGDWKKIVKIFFGTKRILKALAEESGLVVFNLNVAEKPGAGAFFLEHLHLLENLLDVAGTDGFLFFISKLMLHQEEQQPSFLELELDTKKNYYQIILMLGFSYESSIDFFKKHYNIYKEEARAVFYEALMRGDYASAESLKTISNTNDISKLNQKKQKKDPTDDQNHFKLFQFEKEKITKENISYTDQINVNLNDLIKCMKQKYQLTKENEREKISFISFPNEFVSSLIKIDLIQEETESQFKSTIAKIFTYSSLEDRVAAIEAKNQTIEEKLKFLENEVNQALEKIEQFINGRNMSIMKMNG